MRILTIGPSPHLLTRDGRISRDVMLGLVARGHHVEGVVWHHSLDYFLPSETGKHLFTDGGISITLHPFTGLQGGLPAFAFDAMITSQPQVVITIGGYEETSFVAAFKAVYPNLFKWVMIVPSGTNFVAERFRMSLGYADQIVVTSAAAAKAFASVRARTEYVPYGPSSHFSPPESKTSDFRVLSMAKNSQMSNVPAFLSAMSQTQSVGTLHANMDDGGDYDVSSLMRRYGLGGKVMLPKGFMSVRDGLADSDLNEMYGRHHVIVDCSLQSATALTVLEAMSTGCLPVGMAVGQVGEVIGGLPSEFRFLVPFETFVGPKEEDMAVICVKELSHSIENIRHKHLSDPDWAAEAGRVAVERAGIFSKDLFVSRISELMETTVACEQSIAVDSFF